MLWQNVLATNVHRLIELFFQGGAVLGGPLGGCFVKRLRLTHAAMWMPAAHG